MWIKYCIVNIIINTKLEKLKLEIKKIIVISLSYWDPRMLKRIKLEDKLKLHYHFIKLSFILLLAHYSYVY